MEHVEYTYCCICPRIWWFLPNQERNVCQLWKQSGWSVDQQSRVQGFLGWKLRFLFLQFLWRRNRATRNVFPHNFSDSGFVKWLELLIAELVWHNRVNGLFGIGSVKKCVHLRQGTVPAGLIFMYQGLMFSKFTKLTTSSFHFIPFMAIAIRACNWDVRVQEGWIQRPERKKGRTGNPPRPWCKVGLKRVKTENEQQKDVCHFCVRKIAICEKWMQTFLDQ